MATDHSSAPRRTSRRRSNTSTSIPIEPTTHASLVALGKISTLDLFKGTSEKPTAATTEALNRPQDRSEKQVVTEHKNKSLNTWRCLGTIAASSRSLDRESHLCERTCSHYRFKIRSRRWLCRSLLNKFKSKAKVVLGSVDTGLHLNISARCF